MEDTRKRPGGDVTESESSTKRQRDHAKEGGSDITAPPVKDVVLLDTSDETLSELARLLDSDYRPWTAASTSARVTFSVDPYKTPKVFQTMLMLTSYVIINGNEESCGSSFSEAESSVMASVDTTGRDIEQVRLDYEWYEAEKWAEGVGECGFDDGAWEVREEAARGGVELSLDMEWDDDALARFVGEDLN